MPPSGKVGNVPGMKRLSSGVWAVGALSFFPVALAPLPSTAAPGGRISCASPVAGPCETPETFTYLPQESGLGNVLVTNFGILVPGGTPGGNAWDLVCDDTFGLTPPGRIRRSTKGELFAASNEGLYFSSDGCTFAQAGGDLAGQIVFDVAFDQQDPNKVWALGNIPRVIYRSDDGGRTFTTVRAFANTFTFHRVVVAPSDGQRIYVLGRAIGTATPMAISTDGGATFTTGDLALAATEMPHDAFDFVDISPTDPLTLFFVVLNPAGDQLWRTSDGGQSISRVLAMVDEEIFAGFTFGATPDAVYATGTNLFPVGGVAPSHLYRSTDGGTTWTNKVGAKTDPDFRCLAFANGKLYACGAGDPAQDNVMLAVSDNGGETWTPQVQITNLTGAKTCVRDQCTATELWLCESYQQCAPGLMPDGGFPPKDAGTAPDAPTTPTDAPTPPDTATTTPDAAVCVGTACHEDQGCSCRIGTRPGSRAFLLLPLIALLLRFRGLLRRRSSSSPGPKRTR